MIYSNLLGDMNKKEATLTRRRMASNDELKLFHKLHFLGYLIIARNKFVNICTA